MAAVLLLKTSICCLNPLLAFINWPTKLTFQPGIYLCYTGIPLDRKKPSYFSARYLSNWPATPPCCLISFSPWITWLLNYYQCYGVNISSGYFGLLHGSVTHADFSSVLALSNSWSCLIHLSASWCTFTKWDSVSVILIDCVRSHRPPAILKICFHHRPVNVLLTSHSFWRLHLFFTINKQTYKT